MLLGGYGNAGRHIARIVLAESDARVILAGRHLAAATAAAAALDAEFGPGRTRAAFVDAADPVAMTQALVAGGARILVVAASTISHAREVASAALDAGADYLDVQISSTAKHAALEGLRQRIDSEGRCFITDGGFRPGIPAAMIRYAAEQLPGLSDADVASVFQLDWAQRTFSDSSAEEFAEELKSYSSLVLRDREWTPAKMSEMPEFDFGEPFGKRRCSPMFMEELRGLPEAVPSLRSAGFYSGGLGRVVDYVVIPFSLLLVKVAPERSRSLVGRLFRWGLTRHTRPPYGAVLRLDARGAGSRRMSVTVSHEDTYALTAIGAAASLLQYLDGTIASPGLRTQAMAVEPGRFFDDLSRLGVTVLVDGEPAPARQASLAAGALPASPPAPAGASRIGPSSASVRQDL
jgi:saccharopine dehydrogenase (NAD+, L-lysine-forming)